MLKEKILELLDEKVNEIFFKMQEELKINNGDIYPLDALYLEELEEKLAEHIKDVLMQQKEGN